MLSKETPEENPEKTSKKIPEKVPQRRQTKYQDLTSLSTSDEQLSGMIDEMAFGFNFKEDLESYGFYRDFFDRRM